MKYEPHDIVLVKSRWISEMPLLEVELLKKEDPSLNIWHAKLTKQKQVEMLREEYNIPFEYPDELETMVYEEEIVKTFSPDTICCREHKK